MKFIIALLLLVSPLSIAKSIYDESIRDASSISESLAIDAIESFVWGYGRSALVSGCVSIGDNKLDENFPSRMIADHTWVYLKYNVNQNHSLIGVLMSYIPEAYPCKKGD